MWVGASVLYTRPSLINLAMYLQDPELLPTTML